MTAAGVESFLREREHLIAAAQPGADAARALSDLTDRAVSALAGTALSSLGRPWGVLALGGWGAQRLLPLSDLDLLVITDAPAVELRPALQRVLYPLWDGGLTVGHQVRSRAQHLRAVREDVRTLTATLTGRALCGDEPLAAGVLGDVAADARRRSRALVRALMARERPGSPYLLEPDLKEGAGGQRDLDELAWLDTVLTGSPEDPRAALGGAGVLSADETTLLESAREWITAARWAVHRQVARPTSVMTLEIACDTRLDLARVQSALADTHHLLLRARARLGMRLLPGDAPDAPPLSADDVFALLDRGETGLPDLEDAAWAGRLDGLVPSFAELMHLRRPAFSHRYTVGAHSLRCASNVVGAAETDAVARRALASIVDRRVVQTAALLHDVGKAESGSGHARRGAAAVRALGRGLGLSEGDVEDAERLVAEHLLLPETASGRDIHDEDVILETAARLGRRDLVAPLFLLTLADSMATAPGAWTPWHAALVGELADRLEIALSDEVEGAGIAQRAERVRRAVLASATLEPDGESVERFVRGASLRYLAAVSAADVVTHARLAGEIASLGAALPAAVAVAVGPAEGTWGVSVAMADRTGAFAATCGALALSGLDIMSADAFDMPGDVALDVFVVRPDTLADVGAGTWDLFERSLVSALADPLSLDVRLRERRRHYAVRARVRTEVETETAESYATAVRVTTADRVGVLYDLARAIADTGLDIRWARALTRAGVARDVFHVTDASGEPVDDPGVLGHLAMRIRERL